MTVVAANYDGWVIDHWDAVKLTIYGHEDSSCQHAYRLKPDLFNIMTPFLMDSQVKSLISQESKCETEKRKKKRKRKLPMNFGEERALEYHKKVREILVRGNTSLLKAAQCQGHFTETPPTCVSENNTQARQAASIEGPGWSLLEMSLSEQVPFTASCPVREIRDVEDSVVNTIWKNSKSVSMTTCIGSDIYLIPDYCTFLLSDIKFLSKSYTGLGKFDLIVIDPPWENKSVKRQKRYSSLGNYELLDLPLQHLMAPGCLVVVWVTNRHVHRHFLSEQFFPHYRIHNETTWTWLKVTKFGELVYELDSPHKKPYETLMIGRFQSKDTGHHGNDTEIPRDKIIMSVPCGLHSKKPPLQDVLRSYLPKDPKCLELFARNLLPCWTSWGNEVILHQHRDFYQEVT